VMDLYTRCRKLVEERFGYDLFFVYGTLLGAVREGGYIGHDVDFDAAYVSRHCDGREAAQELVELGQALVRRGLVVDARRACLHVHRPEDPETRIDVFHVYFDEEGALAFPWGVAGTSTIRRSDWQGARTRRIDFPGGWGLVPTEAELLVEHLYGPDWRLPSPGFNWNLARTASAVEGHLCEDQRAIVHWDALYAHQGLGAGSSFCELVNGRSDVPDVVVDLGCGNGSDALVFAASGRSVVGLERSEVGVEQARRYAQELGLSAQARFEVCDFHDADGLFRLLAQLVPPDRPVLYYLRFLLHAVDEHVEQTLVRTITRRARSGDQLAVEFRTEQDANRPKHQRRLRPRFLAADAFRARLEAAGFVRVLEQESAGLSPYRGEDPILYRVLARRP
jgi:SAM-dependent methyltransferase